MGGHDRRTEARAGHLSGPHASLQRAIPYDRNFALLLLAASSTHDCTGENAAVFCCANARERENVALFMASKPIPGSTGEVLTCLPSPYIAHPATGLLYLPRFLAKCRYVKEHGALPASYAKNYKRGLDRFLCLHLGIDPVAVEQLVHACIDAGLDDAERDERLRALLPANVRAAKWNRELVQKGMTPAGREFLQTALAAMGCADRVDEIRSVPDLIDFDEGRID
jgi:hypothetical protein